MPATLTLTGTAGPGNSLSAVVFNNVSEFRIVADQNMIYFVQNNLTKEVSVNAATTVTATKTGTTWTLVIS